MTSEADKLNNTFVNAATQQGHGSTGTIGTSRDVVGIEPELGSQDSCDGLCNERKLCTMQWTWHCEQHTAGNC
jgi:hypothetical protein